MTRKTYVIRDGQCVEKSEAIAAECNAPMVMGDLKPYQSMLTGETVTSRSRHRQLLREHGCIEVGNETRYLKQRPITIPGGRKEKLIQAVRKHRGY